MKKRVIALLLAGGLVLSNGIFVSANTVDYGTSTEATQKQTYQYKTADEAIAEANANDIGKTLFIDARRPRDYQAGHMRSAINVYPKINGFETNYELLAAYAKTNLLNNNKNVFIICYGGQTYAPPAADGFIKAGVDPARIFIVKGGTYSLQGKPGYEALKRKHHYITMESALENQSQATFLDVRKKEAFDNGHIKDSNWIRAFAEDEVAFKEEAAKLDSTKPIYIVGNNGEELAENAQQWLADLGFTKVYTIVGGASKNPNAPWVKTIPLTPIEPSIPVEPEKPEIPLTPIGPSTPVEPEKPHVPQFPIVDQKPVIEQKPIVDQKPIVNQGSSNVPKTGDLAPITGCIATMSASLGIIILDFKRRKKF